MTTRDDNLHACNALGNEASLIARFMGPTWGPSGAERTQVGPMLAPWTLLSGLLLLWTLLKRVILESNCREYGLRRHDAHMMSLWRKCAITIFMPSPSISVNIYWDYYLTKHHPHSLKYDTEPVYPPFVTMSISPEDGPDIAATNFAKFEWMKTINLNRILVEMVIAQDWFGVEAGQRVVIQCSD